MRTKSTTLTTSTTPKPMTTETITTTRPLYKKKKKDELSLYEKQVMKLQSLLSGPQGDIRSVLLQETVLKLLPNCLLYSHVKSLLIFKYTGCFNSICPK